jgi:hypothetical protein
MKKTLFFVIILLTSRVALAQFEGAICEPSFIEFFKNTLEESIIGKTIICEEYPAGALIKGNEMTPGQALKLAWVLIKDPKDLGLSRLESNLLITPKGVLNIQYLKSQWRIFFFKKEKHPLIYTKYGARIFKIN